MKEIKLSQNKIAVVDDDDFDYLSKFVWHVVKLDRGYFYACHSIVGSRWFMHRLITKAPKHLQVDHINHDTLDNRKENLRIVTALQNAQNSRKSLRLPYKGVTECPQNPLKRKYRARIRVKGKIKHLGYFPTAIEAAKIYDEAASFYFGNYACLNFKETQNAP
jgi:hypothetical protein